jgi:selenocysteine lyase/cysteine desulfurase
LSRPNIQTKPLALLTSDGEFHSFRRQAARWQEQDIVRLREVPCEPFGTFTERYLEAVAQQPPDVAFVSHVMYKTGLRFDGIDTLASYAQPDRTWVVIDGYHAFMAFPVDLGSLADRVFYLAGGYKYAMSGEGAGFLSAPPQFGPRPTNTGWFAEFASIEAQTTGLSYPANGMRFMGATFDPSALYRFNAVRAMLDAEQLDTAAVHERVEYLRNKLEAAIISRRVGILNDAQMLNPNASGPNSRYIALRDARASDLKAILLERDVVADARGDILRIGFGLYHNDVDIDMLCHILERGDTVQI